VRKEDVPDGQARMGDPYRGEKGKRNWMIKGNFVRE